MYVDVEAFARLAGVPVIVHAEDQTVIIKDKKISAVFIDGIATAHIRELADATGGTTSVTWDPVTRTVYVKGLADPAGSRPEVQPEADNEVQPAQEQVTIPAWASLAGKWLFFITATIFFGLVFMAFLISLFKDELTIAQRIPKHFKLTKSMRIEKPSKNQGSGSSFQARILQPTWAKMQAFVAKRMSSQSSRLLETKLRDAGYPFGLTPINFRLIQILLGMGVFLLVIFFANSKGFAMQKALPVALLAGWYGWMNPEIYLKAKKQRRIITIEKEMPDFFDMTNLAIEAGMGFDAAVLKACQKTKGPLSVEFNQSLDDMRLGRSRREAFTDLMNRVPSELFQSVIRSIIQADQLGIGISKVLRAQTRRIREQQRQKAREKAMKVPVKMLLPMVAFIFPALFVVLLGPLVIYLITKGLGV
jgi:tight adherence protein C